MNISAAEAIVTISTGIITAAFWILGKQARVTTRNNKIDAHMAAQIKKDEEQDEHMEFMDKNFQEFKEDVSNKLDRVLEFMGDFKATGVRIGNLEKENGERHEEHKKIDGKVDRIFKGMGDIKIQIAGLKR